MPTSQFLRGAVLKCRFPYDHHPHRPGPQPHYCLFAKQIEVGEQQVVAVCYGTSRLDDALIEAHQGLIFDVPSSFVRGTMPGPITHFVADHVAILPIDWIQQDFVARLDFMREEKRQNDTTRRRLYQQFEAFESAMKIAAVQATQHFTQTGQMG